MTVGRQAWFRVKELPSHRVHVYMDKVFFGKSYWRIHRAMDWPYLYVGRHHREYFHDAFSCSLIALEEYSGDPHAYSAALLHVQLDELCSWNPGYKRHLEMMAELEAEERKRKRRKRKKRRKQRKRRRMMMVDREFEEFILKVRRFEVLARVFFGS